MKVQTKCKFCRREIEMEVDQKGYENPMINAALWLKNIACNRCADYYNAKRKLTDGIGKICQVVQNSSGNDKVTAAAREKLTQRTKELSKLICDFKLIQFTWDSEFVNFLMAKPDKFSTLINTYCSGLNRIQAQAETGQAI